MPADWCKRPGAEVGVGVKAVMETDTLQSAQQALWQYTCGRGEGRGGQVTQLRL